MNADAVPATSTVNGSDTLGRHGAAQRQAYVLRTVEERGVRLVRLWFTDVLGQLKSVAISPMELEAAFNEGLQFDGSAIDGFSRIQESDVLAHPDANSFEILPWSDRGELSARIFCDISNLDGTPFAGDPRQVLRRNLAVAHDAGFEFMAAPEIEYFYFDQAAAAKGKLKPLDHAGYFDLSTHDIATDVRRRTISVLESMGIPIEYSFHEDAPSQHEIDLRYTDGLTMADSVMSLRLVVREIAQEHGVYATFLPKPLAGVQGSGMHTHLSLFRGDENAFADPDDQYGLSATARSFIAGLLFHAPEITAITNQLVNSYKRLVAGFEAPVHICWARNNRSALVRVPVTKEGKHSSTRLEYRSPDPACNPYLAFSLLLAAGLKGITEQYELPEEAATNLFEFDNSARSAHGIPLLPQSLSEALDVMEGSDLVRDTLGTHIFEWFLRNKRAEWSSYKTHVSQFEIDRYLQNW